MNAPLILLITLINLYIHGLASAKGTKDSAQAKTVKVFILAGQSNMEGHGLIKGRPGQVGTLEQLTNDPKTSKQYKKLKDSSGNWKERNDVWISWHDKKGNLAIGGYAGRGSIGPELGFGWAVGDHFDDPVLLLKFGPGGTSLAGPWRPPSSGNNGNKERGEGIGDQYDHLISSTKRQLKNLGSEFPQLKGLKYELAGFGWHQGWNDGCSMKDSKEYESNMANFIRDVRKDLNAPELPFVIAGSGFGGWEQKIDRRLMIMSAQKSVAESNEFKQNARYVETRGFFRDGPVSPRPIRYHWCCNAETYWLIGDGMGRAMVEILKSVTVN
ncbi:MAG: sialate O-acetylesterase [Verrucomicrobiota bacterium]|nr:sialate O-acetylesterase [Verrucomicrobiota bacterium]MEE2967678.1 sialate O-acetylesterase [Verrucomicrobiota bacterium]